MGILDIFGSPEELRSFALIFFGTLVPAALLAALRHRKKSLPLPSERGYDATILVLGLWCMSGLLIDVYAHRSGEVDDSFFTKWHAIWYSGATAYGGFILFALWRLSDRTLKLSPKGVWQFMTNVPKGYGASVAGIVIFGFSGFADMLWHSFFGIEGGLDILLSPSHLGLAIGLILSVFAPVLSGWQDPESGSSGLRSQLVILFGFGSMWIVVLLFSGSWDIFQLGLSEYCMHYTECTATGYERALERGVIASVVPPMVATGLFLIFSRRWDPSPGSYLILFLFWGVGNFAMNGLEPRFIGMALIIGSAMELLRIWLASRDAMSGRARDFIFAGALSFCMLMTHLAWTLQQTGWATLSSHGQFFIAPYGWTIHGTSGSFVLAMSACVMLAFAMNPPAFPED